MNRYEWTSKAGALLLLFFLCMVLQGVSHPKEAEIQAPRPESYGDVVQEVDIAVEPAVSVAAPVNTSPVYLGEFSSTGYCIENYPHICNNGDANITATGGRPIPGKTVAVDPAVIPLGSVLFIEYGGKQWMVTANDSGGAIRGKKIDLVFDSHDAALEWGVRPVKVWIKDEEESK